MVSPASPKFLEYDVTFAAFITTTGGSGVEVLSESELQLPSTIKSCNTAANKTVFFILIILYIFFKILFRLTS
ncbi:hypothetical protein D3C87_1909880 [compost metagenome]